MAFALKKSSGEKKSPLAGWLGKKSTEAEPEYFVPEEDVVASLNRALRNPMREAEQHKKDTRVQLGPIRDALGAIESALYAIDRIRDVLEQAVDVVVSARDIDDTGGRAMMAESYDELRLSIDAALTKIDPRAVVLIGTQQRHIDVNLGGKTRYSVSPVRLDTSERGLNLSPPREAFDSTDEIETTLDQLDKALALADKASTSYCNDAQYLIARMNAAMDAAGYSEDAA